MNTWCIWTVLLSDRIFVVLYGFTQKTQNEPNHPIHTHACTFVFIKDEINKSKNKRVFSSFSSDSTKKTDSNPEKNDDYSI